MATEIMVLIATNDTHPPPMDDHGTDTEQMNVSRDTTCDQSITHII